jgi:hypothetical protein
LCHVQVLEVATREGNVSDNLDLAIANLGDDDLVTEVTDAALDLDAVVEELLEGGDIEDLVVGGLRSIDDELQTRNISDCKRSDRELQAFTHLLSDLLSLAGTDLLNRKDSISLLFHLSGPRLSRDASSSLLARFLSLLSHGHFGRWLARTENECEERAHHEHIGGTAKQFKNGNIQREPL